MSRLVSVGDPPRIMTNLGDVVVNAPETATLECGIKPGMKNFEVRHSYNVKFLILTLQKR